MKLLFREHNPQLYGAGGPVVFDWRPGGNHVVVAGPSGVTRVFNRYGDIIEDFNINEEVTLLDWDRDGEVLAISNSRTAVLVLYELSTSNLQAVDFATGAKAIPSWIGWSPKTAILLVGDNKGNVVIYNHHTSRKVPILGKHQRAIKSGAWNQHGTVFALGSDDTTITLNNESGETLNTFSCGGEITELRFTNFRSFTSDRNEDFISAVVSNKNLMIVRLSEPEAPTNLQFQERYGNIVKTLWFGNGNILIGFDRGFIVCLSAERSTDSVSQELFSIQEYKNYLSSLAINLPMRRMLSVGDNLLKTRDLGDLSEICDLVDVDSDDSGLVSVACSDDGSLTAVSAKSGAFCVYLTKLPVMASAYKNCVAVLSSLTEIAVYLDGEIQPAFSLNVKVEPSLVSVGERHIAVVLNNKAWFYELRKNSAVYMYEHDYITTVLKLMLNRDFVAARLDKKVHLHKIAKSSTSSNELSRSNSMNIENEGKSVGGEDAWKDKTSELFPDCNEMNNSDAIIDSELTERFFVYTTKSKYIYYYSLSFGRFVSDFKHSAEVRSLFCESDGIRSLFLDEYHDAYLYSPVEDGQSGAIRVPGPGPFHHHTGVHYRGCLWETFTVDKDTFVMHDDVSMFVFIASRNERQEPTLSHIATVAIPFGNTPLVLSKGIVYCHTQNGRVNTVLLKSHRTDTNFSGKSPAEMSEMLDQSLTLKRWRNAWKICEGINEPETWRVFSKAALADSQIDLAIRIFRLLGDISMVWALEELLYVEDQQIVGGHIAAILGNYDVADELFMRSSEPRKALDMRRDVQHWERALELAKKIAPNELPLVAKEYAMQLEFLGKHEDALHYYESAVIESNSSTSIGGKELALTGEELDEHNWVCKSGLARMALHVGDLRRGVDIALELPSRLAKRDCGIVLEQLRQFEEAGRVYEAGQFYDRAVAAFLKSKNLLKVHKLLEHVRSPKLLTQYGRIAEKERNFERAYNAYERAADAESMIRVLLRHLNRTEEAVRLAQESRSIEGAKLVANHFAELGNNDAAIEFLVLSQCYQEAFDLAKRAGRMSIYARAVEPLGADCTVQFTQLAEYFKTHGDVLNAGKFIGLAGQYAEAVHLLMQAEKENEDALRHMINFAAASDDKALVNELIDFFIGEKDGMPKDPKFLFQLYVKLKMYKEGAKTAVIIAQEQQSKGYYKTAHDLLFEMYFTLRKEKIHIPAEMENNLQVIHSYNIVKGLIKRNESYNAAQLLIRIASNIGQFPAHAVQILTSAVITCTKAGLKSSAFKFASQLMQPGYRAKIDEKYRRKIEMIVRKSSKDDADSVDERPVPCPHCETPVKEFTLSCSNCQSSIPYCVVTGRHVDARDFALCPHCQFPGYFSEFSKLIGQGCPMCSQELSVDAVKLDNFAEYVKAMEQTK